MTPAALTGLLASALALGALATWLPSRHRQLAGWIAVVAALPTIAPWLHGALGSPSFTLAQLALLRLLAPGQPTPLGRNAALALVTGAMLLYPLALGLGPFDPYDLGYRPLPLLLALAPLGLWLAWRGPQAWLLLLAGDLLAYAGGLYDNLWNALADPLLILLAAIVLARRALSAPGNR